MRGWECLFIWGCFNLFRGRPPRRGRGPRSFWRDRCNLHINRRSTQFSFGFSITRCCKHRSWCQSAIHRYRSIQRWQHSRSDFLGELEFLCQFCIYHQHGRHRHRSSKWQHDHHCFFGFVDGDRSTFSSDFQRGLEHQSLSTKCNLVEQRFDSYRGWSELCFAEFLQLSE